MKFEMLGLLQEEQRSRKEEVSRKKSVFESEEKKLVDLKDQVQALILNNADEDDLDKVYDEIAKQETITERRRNEYQLVSERPNASKFTQKEVLADFNQIKAEYNESTIDPFYEKLGKIKKDYLDTIAEMENAMRLFNVEAKQVDYQLQRIQKISGGPNYGSSNIRITAYNELDILVPRSPDLW